MDNMKDLIISEIVPDMMKNNVFKEDLVNNDCWSIQSVEVSPLNADGTFMLTVCNKVKITLSKKSDSKELKIYKLVIKVTPEINDEFYVSAQFDELFSNEILAYTELIPMFSDTMEHIRYFYSYRKHLQSCMVLEDFNTYGWRMATALTDLSLEHILVAVKELGRFHGKCYGFKLSDNEKFMDIKNKFKESRYSNEVSHPIWLQMLTNAPKRAYKSVKNNKSEHNIPDEFLEKLENLLNHPHKYGKKMVIPKEPLANICHGDFLRNNIAFQYDSDSVDTAIPLKALLFDFQTLRYASPMVDLCVFMFNSTGYETRTKNFNLIFDTYFNEILNLLEKHLKEKKNIPSYFNRDNFLKEYTRFLPFALGIAAPFLPVMLTPTDFPMEEMSDCSPAAFEKNRIALESSGGEKLNVQLRGMVYDIYNFHKKYNIDIFEE